MQERTSPLKEVAHHWSERSARAALGRLRRNVVTTISGVLFSSLFLSAWFIFLPEGREKKLKWRTPISASRNFTDFISVRYILSQLGVKRKIKLHQNVNSKAHSFSW